MNRRSDVPLLAVEDLHVSFPIRSGLLRRQTGEVQAVSGVSFTIQKGQTHGLVGESGCGKSTTARAIVGLEDPKSGSVRFEGRDLAHMGARERRQLSREIQMIFQDPFSSLNPRLTVRQLIAEGWEIHPSLQPTGSRDAEVSALLERVGLNPDHADRYPHQFSGGQRQRIGVARALALSPKLIVCDEPVSALDVSIQAQVLNLLSDLQEDLGIAYLFIAHDLSVVRHISHRVSVMYLGQIVETGDEHDIYEAPTHPYTQALLSSVPTPRPWRYEGRERIVLEGELPSPANPPTGCRFRTRCWKAEPICSEKEPELVDRFGHGHPSACHFAALEPEVVPTLTKEKGQ